MIDLQKGVSGSPLAPRSGAEVVECASTKLDMPFATAPQTARIILVILIGLSPARMVADWSAKALSSEFDPGSH